MDGRVCAPHEAGNGNSWHEGTLYRCLLTLVLRINLNMRVVR